MFILSLAIGFLMSVWGIIMILFGRNLGKDLRNEKLNAGGTGRLKYFVTVCQIIGVALILVGIYILIG